MGVCVCVLYLRHFRVMSCLDLVSVPCPVFAFPLFFFRFAVVVGDKLVYLELLLFSVRSGPRILHGPLGLCFFYYLNLMLLDEGMIPMAVAFCCT